MIRFAAILLTMLGLALGPAGVNAAPLCAAPGEMVCGCAKATTGSCCSAATKSCCSDAVQPCCSDSVQSGRNETHGDCCGRTSGEDGFVGSTCDGCNCCVEPLDNPLTPASRSETHVPVDWLVWTTPAASQPALLTLSRHERDDLVTGPTVSLQVLHCRWRN